MTSEAPDRKVEDDGRKENGERVYLASFSMSKENGEGTEDSP